MADDIWQATLCIYLLLSNDIVTQHKAKTRDKLEINQMVIVKMQELTVSDKGKSFILYCLAVS